LTGEADPVPSIPRSRNDLMSKTTHIWSGIRADRVGRPPIAKLGICSRTAGLWLNDA
jgi:hypothetical protein